MAKSKSRIDKERRIEYGRKVNSFFGSIRRDEERAVKEVLNTIKDIRQSTLNTLAFTDDFQLQRLRELEGGLNRAMDELDVRLKGQLKTQARGFWEVGTEAAIQPVEDTFGISISTVPPPELFDALTATQSDLVTEITQRARREVNNEIRLAAIGAKRPQEAKDAIAKMLSPRAKKGKGGVNDPEKTRASLAARAERIVRTEMNRTYTVAQFEGMKRIKEVVPDAKKEWQTNLDGRQRHSHDTLDGVSIPMGQKFKFQGREGRTSLMYPRDPAGKPEEVVACFLPGTLVEGDFIAGSKAVYSGPAREFKTARGKRLCVTPNHPIMSTKGLIPAKQFSKGDYFFSSSSDIQNRVHGDIDNQDGPIPIEDVFDTLAADRTPRLAMVGTLDFHGDAEFFDGKVGVVGMNGELSHSFESSFSQSIDDLLFILAHPRLIVEAGLRELDLCFRRFLSASIGLPSGGALTLHDSSVFGIASALLPFQNLGIAPASNAHSDSYQRWSNYASMRPGFFGNSIDAHAGEIPFLPLGNIALSNDGVAPRGSFRSFESVDQSSVSDSFTPRELSNRLSCNVALDEIVEIRDFEFCGHVYDLQSETGLIVAGGIVSSNCRCQILFTRDDFAAAIELPGATTPLTIAS